MATIDMLPHNERPGTWILVWDERGEVIGRVQEDDDGLYSISPRGQHWSPMKSFAANRFTDAVQALHHVRLYFGDR